MKMNKLQKRTILIALLIIVIVFIIWLITGGDIFTKTQVLIEKKDELFGTTYKEWQDKFVFGLLPSGFSLTLDSLSVASLSGVVVVVSGILFFIFKKKEINEKTT
jgi:ABC-type Fe3+ transport system permease subunit